MKQKLLIYLAAVALLGPSVCHASSLDLPRLLTRRQSGGETEQEATTTPKSATDPGQQQAPPSSTPASGASPTQGRLYPDLPGQNPANPNFLPPFNADPRHGSMPPFVPFGMPVGSRLNADQQPGPFGPRMLPLPRPMSPAERLQSQSFTNGLGQRLLAMIGIDTSSQQNQTTDGGQPVGSANPRAMPALQNSTVLNELNKRVNMLMGSLSKMYNSTVQEQLNLLNETYHKETDNNKNPWQQRVAQQVPGFFKQMADRVGNAQEQLNRVWRDVVQVAQGNTVQTQPNQPGGPPNRQPGQFFGAIDRLMFPSGEGSFFGGPNEGGDFVNQMSRSLGMQPEAPSGGAANDTQRADLGARLREFWHAQVQPQIGMVRGQMARVWRDLTTSGALTPDTMARSRFNQNGNNNNDSTNNDLVDSLLKEADTEAADFALIPPKSGDSPQAPEGGNNPASQQPSGGMPRLSPQMQNRLVMMQRDLNQLWQGLSSSLQNAMHNVKGTLNPRQQQATQDVDPAQNEINTKVQNLSKLQREADVVYDTVQKQQRDVQQRQTFADRVRGFMDMSGFNQLPGQINDQVNRIGTVIGDFWKTIPDRLDNMMSQRQNEQNQAKMREMMNARTSTSTPKSTPGSEIPQ